MNRADLVREALLLMGVQIEAKTRLEVIRQSLAADACAELARDGSAPTWRIPGVGTVPLALSQDAVDVVDEAAYTGWVARRYPTEIEQRVRPAFDRAFRAAAAQRGAACDDEGTVVPGLLFRAGGAPTGVSIRPAADAKTATLQLAGDLLDALTAAALEVPGA